MILAHKLNTAFKCKVYIEHDFDLLPNIEFIIVDEADLVARNQVVSFRQKKGAFVQQGLFSLINKPLLMCTATFTELEKEIVMRLLNIE